MTLMRKLIRAVITPVGDDEVDVVMSTAAMARDGHVLVPQGCMLENYRANPIVLWSHDADKPIGNAENIEVGADQITARIRFAPLGISAKADEIRGLMKAGVVRAVSVGFDPIDMEPLDPKKPRGGQRIAAWDLLELSAVSVPADTSAMVTARAHGDNNMPEITPPTLNQVAARRSAIAQRATPVLGKRGLYQVAQLAYLFSELDYQVDWAKWEAAAEEDASKVPAMLAGVLHDLGDALIAMTQEEVAEALAGHDLEPEEDPDDDVLLDTERAAIKATGSPYVRALRRGLAHAKHRAGKTLSNDTVQCLRDAVAMHEEAIAKQRSGIADHKKAISSINDLIDRSGTSDPEDDTLDQVQTSAGVDGSDGSENGRSADWRRRDLEILALAAV